MCWHTMRPQHTQAIQYVGAGCDGHRNMFIGRQALTDDDPKHSNFVDSLSTSDGRWQVRTRISARTAGAVISSSSDFDWLCPRLFAVAPLAHMHQFIVRRVNAWYK
jgi:hypothetical protein